MSPRYEPDPTSVQSTLAVLDKGRYEFVIGKPKAFQRTSRKGTESVGVRYPMVVAEGPSKGARNIYTCYIHSEGGQSFAKQYLMAALGFKANQEEEKRFDAQFKGKNWGVDTDSGEVGEVWESLEGKRVTADVDIGVDDETGNQNQKWSKFYPVGTTT